MNELTESLRWVLDNGGELIEVILNGLSLLCIIIGIIFSFKDTFQFRRSSKSDHPLHTFFRTVFGGWLIVALEFQLAADIAGTIVSPTTAHLIELGAIALIRTFLNYFLSKELTEESEAMKEERESMKNVERIEEEHHP